MNPDHPSFTTKGYQTVPYERTRRYGTRTCFILAINVGSILNSPWTTASVSSQTVRDALQLSAKFQINYWDAAIIAAARELGCHTVFSEDLSHGQDYDGVVVMNPFVPFSDA